MRTRIIQLVTLFWSLVLCSPCQAAWQEAHSKHFIIFADEPSDELLAYSRKLERFDHAVRVVRNMDDPPLADRERLTIYVLSNTNSIAKLAGGGVAGFYIPRVTGSVAFVPHRAGMKGDILDLDPDSVFFHEYSHHLQLQSADIAMPPWVTEGFAEFFAKTQLRDDGSVVIGLVPLYRAPGLYDDPLSLKRMLAADTNLNPYEVSAMYGRGWLLLHYLTFNQARRGQLQRYVAAIQEGTSPLVSAQRAFGDLGRLNAELDGYLYQKNLPTFVLKSIDVPADSIKLRLLSSGEAEMMRVRIRSEADPNKSEAADIAGDARQIAKKYPADAVVQTWLAQAEFDRKNFAAAETAADQALALDPTRIAALLYKGKAEMELARQHNTSVNWSNIREWFLKANQLDPEAAEPLMRYYQSFIYAGEKPTKNAVSGLVYSLTLVPQDQTVRLLTVRQLIDDGNLPGAKRYFAAFAFEPHADSQLRSVSNKAMTAISNGHREEALKYIEQLEQIEKIN